MNGINWEVVCEVMRPRLVGVARSVLHDEHEAEDVTQEALLACWSKAATLRDPGAVEGWMVSVVRTRAINSARSRSRRSRFGTLGREVRGEEEPEDRRAMLPEESPELAEALDRMSPSLRRTLDSDLSGLSLDEIAAQEEVSYGAAKGRLSRARARVKSLMKGDVP